MKFFKKLNFYILYVYRFCEFIFLGAERYAKKLGVQIGTGCRIYIRDFGAEPFLISIGNNVTITSGVKLLTHDGATWLVRDKNGRRYKYAKIEIGNNVFIGTKSIILPGVKIGNNTIIAAGSVVVKSVPDNSIVGGNPATVIGSFESYKIKTLKNMPAKKDIISEGIYKDDVYSYLEFINNQRE